MDLAIIIAVVVVALAFDYTNGFHDAANAIATSVSTRALTPRIALALAAVMNFVGAFLGQKVATTVSDTIDPGTGAHGLVIVMSGLLGAIAWNLITWYYGLPSSSSHALIGGLVGAALAAGVTVSWDTVIEKVVIPMLISPIFAFAAGFAVMLAIMWIFRKASPHRLNRGFRLAQTASAAAMALGHGLQDAQKTMGVIFLALLTGGYVADGDPLPLWVIFAAAAAISAGPWAGGWRSLRHLRRRIIPLVPPPGFPPGGWYPRPVRHEALLRVAYKSGPDDNTELVLPAAFIPAAERYGLMNAIDRWVIRTAFRDYAGGIGQTGARIALNLSGNSLSDETLLDFIEAQFAEHAFPPEQVCFEITETAAIQNLRRALELLAALKRHGSQLALDDFGSGLSSFHYLKTLPVDYVKIDGSFVKDMIENPSDSALVAAINQMSHSLGIQTVAEYVHSQAIAERLRGMGVDYAQGYFFGQPTPWGKTAL